MTLVPWELLAGRWTGGECSAYNLGAFASFDRDEGAYSRHFDEIAEVKMAGME